MNTTQCCVLLATTAVLGSATWLLVSSTSPALPTARAAVRAARTTPPAPGSHKGAPVRRLVPADRCRYGAPVGRRLTYATVFELVTEVAHVAGQGRQSLAVDVAGSLRCTVLARREREMVYGIDWAELRVRCTTGRTAAAPDELVRDLRHCVLVRASSDGEVLGVRMPSEISAAGRGFWRAVIASLRFDLSGASAASWVLREVDPTGSAVVAYQRQDVGDRVEVQRRCESYELSDLQLTSVAVSGRAVFCAELGWFASAVHESRLAADVDELQARIELVQTVGLTWSTTEDLPAGISPAVDWEAAWSDLRGAEDCQRAAEDARQSRAVQELAGQSVGSLVAALDAALRAHGPTADDASRQRRLLVDMLRARPDAARELEPTLARSDVTPELAAFLLSAAGAAGTEPAQSVCSDLAADPRRPEGLRVVGLQALFQTDTPADATLATVRGLAADGSQPAGVSGTAMLLLGAYARGGMADVREVFALEGTALHRGMLHDWFGALGNAGGDAVLGAVQRHLEGEDPAIRAAALVALRRVESACAERAVIARLSLDVDSGVRAAAAEQLAERGSEAALAALERALPGADDAMRAAMKRGLAATRSARGRALLRKCNGGV